MDNSLLTLTKKTHIIVVMAKSIDVKKFGGIDKGGDVSMDSNNYELQSVEAQSKTKLEDDTGHGNAAIIRCFEFGINPVAFKESPPTKQQLFNSHYKGIEAALWRDGLKVLPDVNPRIILGEKTYKIFVGAHPMRGHILREQPRTLRELTHG